ncbi:unnamed protein product [Brachionus calyciflorus]|uniref:Uncharacterized protein n=1 Tax=Brachionus calyciflorus TaxID=104777 RepID=A0A814BYK2_9BILA|nr:unnamed protein product [Brachionus calyciflorus]
MSIYDDDYDVDKEGFQTNFDDNEPSSSSMKTSLIEVDRTIHNSESTSPKTSSRSHREDSNPKSSPSIQTEIKPLGKSPNNSLNETTITPMPIESLPIPVQIEQSLETQPETIIYHKPPPVQIPVEHYQSTPPQPKPRHKIKNRPSPFQIQTIYPLQSRPQTPLPENLPRPLYQDQIPLDKHTPSVTELINQFTSLNKERQFTSAERLTLREQFNKNREIVEQQLDLSILQQQQIHYENNRYTPFKYKLKKRESPQPNTLEYQPRNNEPQTFIRIDSFQNFQQIAPTKTVADSSCQTEKLSHPLNRENNVAIFDDNLAMLRVIDDEDKTSKINNEINYENDENTTQKRRRSLSDRFRSLFRSKSKDKNKSDQEETTQQLNEKMDRYFKPIENRINDTTSHSRTSKCENEKSGQENDKKNQEKNMNKMEKKLQKLKKNKLKNKEIASKPSIHENLDPGQIIETNEFESLERRLAELKKKVPKKNTLEQKKPQNVSKKMPKSQSCPWKSTTEKNDKKYNSEPLYGKIPYKQMTEFDFKKPIKSEIVQNDNIDFELLDQSEQKYEWNSDNLLDKSLKSHFKGILISDIKKSLFTYEIKNQMTQLQFANTYECLKLLILELNQLESNPQEYLIEEFLAFKLSLIVKWLCLILREMHINYLIFKIYDYLDRLFLFLSSNNYKNFLGFTTPENKSLIEFLIFKYTAQNSIMTKYNHYFMHNYLVRMCSSNLTDLYKLIMETFSYEEGYDAIKIEAIQDLKYLYQFSTIDLSIKIESIDILASFLVNKKSRELTEEIMCFFSAFKHRALKYDSDLLNRILEKRQYQKYNLSDLIRAYAYNPDNKTKIGDFIKRYEINYAQLKYSNGNFCKHLDHLMLSYHDLFDYVSNRFQYEPDISVMKDHVNPTKDLVLDCIHNLYRLNYFIQRVDKKVLLYEHANRIIDLASCLLRHYSKKYVVSKDLTDFSVILLVNKLLKIILREKVEGYINEDIFLKLIITLFQCERYEQERGCKLRFRALFEVLLKHVGTSYLFLRALSELIFRKITIGNIDAKGFDELLFFIRKYMDKLSCMRKFEVYSVFTKEQFERLNFLLDNCLRANDRIKMSYAKETDRLINNLKNELMKFPTSIAPNHQ